MIHKVHGIPDHKLKLLYEGDIVSIDCGVCGVLINGYYGDLAYTFKVVEIAPTTQKKVL